MLARKIRILEAIRQGQVGGGETHVLDLVSHLDPDLFEVEVLAFTDGPMIRQLQQRGFITHIIETTKPYDFSIWGKVSQLVAFGHFDLIHAHGTRAASNVFYAARKFQIPLVYTVHGWSFHPGQFPLIRRLRELSEKQLTRQARLTITVSESNRLTGEQRFGLKNARVIYNAINFSRFDPELVNHNQIRREFKIPEGHTLVGYLVRITEQKDPFTLLEAIRIIKEQNEKIHFLIVGNGDLDEAVKQQAASWNLLDCITFSDFRADVPEILRAIDIYCLPSLWEGMPIGLLEAMAMQKACIATGVDGTAEIITDHQNGLLIPCKNPHALANAILELHYEPLKRAFLGYNAQQFVGNRFTIPQMLHEISQVYLHLFTTKNS